MNIQKHKSLLSTLGLICVIGVPACVTCRRATDATPFVINFEFLRPVTRSRGDEANLRKALKFAVPSASLIRSGKTVIWPVNRMHVDLVTKAQGDTGIPEGRAAKPTHTDSNEMMAEGPAEGGDGRPDNRAARPEHTEYVSFASAEDLRHFVDCLAGKPCPDNAAR